MSEINVTTEILTAQEASRRLPQVRPVVARLMKITAEAHQHRLDLMPEPDGTGDGREVTELHAKRRLAELQDEFESYLNRLNDLGAVLKDAESGLIDFFGWMNDEIVHLCWIHGETAVGHWHGLHEGFAGRKPIIEDPA